MAANYEGLRWPKQPWLYPLSDLRPQGEAECQVFTGASVLLALHVRNVGNGTEMIAIRWAKGQPMSAVIPDEGLPMDTDAPNFDIDTCED